MRRSVLMLLSLCACPEQPVSAIDPGTPPGPGPSGGGPGHLDGGSKDAGTADGGAVDAGSCPLKCSADLLHIESCTGRTMLTCAAPGVCDPTRVQCVDPCAAAVAAKSSVGCEYYATHMENLLGAGACFAAFVANTSPLPAKLTVEYDGAALNLPAFARLPQGKGKNITYGPWPGALPPGEVAILFLGGLPGPAPQCPIATAKGTAAMVAGTGRGRSFRVVSDVPVVAYEMNPYGGGGAATTGASLLLPVSAWDTNYIASTASPKHAAPPSINVIAAKDNTRVTLLPKVALDGGVGLPSGPANRPVSFMLQAGEQAQFVQDEDLAGSVIESSAPVGVMAGSPCMNVPRGTLYCDHGEQMLPPVRALGSEYVGAQYRPRHGEPAIWRVVGAVDGTRLSFSTTIAATAGFPAPPTRVDQGDVVEFATGTPFVVKSQDAAHPFLFFQYMSSTNWPALGGAGKACDATTWDGFGDPDFQVQVPPQQWLSRYVIMTDPTYPETNLVLIRRRGADGSFKPVTIACGQAISGWGRLGDYEWTRADLQTGDFADVGGCSNGRHELKSDAPFALGVWGWGSPLSTSAYSCYVSYSYPGGMNVQSINSVVVPPTER